MFPFQWGIEGYGDKPFSKQINLSNIEFSEGSNWERSIDPSVESEVDSLYNERNYFYEFVHNALYDNGNSNSLIWHFERKEPQHSHVVYVIESNDKEYELKVDAINLRPSGCVENQPNGQTCVSSLHI